MTLPAAVSWDDPAGPAVGMIASLFETDRAGMTRVAPGPPALIMPAWSNPVGMTDEEFRVTAGATVARMMGFGSVEWHRGWPDPPVRRVQL